MAPGLTQGISPPHWGGGGGGGGGGEGSGGEGEREGRGGEGGEKVRLIHCQGHVTIPGG